MSMEGETCELTFVDISKVEAGNVKEKNKTRTCSHAHARARTHSVILTALLLPDLRVIEVWCVILMNKNPCETLLVKNKREEMYLVIVQLKKKKRSVRNRYRREEKSRRLQITFQLNLLSIKLMQTWAIQEKPQSWTLGLFPGINCWNGHDLKNEAFLKVFFSRQARHFYVKATGMNESCSYSKISWRITLYLLLLMLQIPAQCKQSRFISCGKNVFER